MSSPCPICHTCHDTTACPPVSIPWEYDVANEVDQTVVDLLDRLIRIEQKLDDLLEKRDE